MRVLLLRNAPSDVYCSNAYYSFPDLTMTEKDWQGADLIFDIDAKDLALSCRDKHVISVCDKCNKTCKQAQCELCGQATDIKQKSLPCKKCMTAAKQQAKLLVDVLRDDLGVGFDEISIYFSGNEGYHVHVAHDAFRSIDARARTDLVDYMMLRGLIPESMGMRKTKFDKRDLPDFGQSGWSGRFAKAVFGSKTRRASIISEFTKSSSAESNYARFQDMIKDAIDKIGIKIDPGVTMDVHRVFRMPHTINSKSSMIKMLCSDIDAFNPYTDAVIAATYDNITSDNKKETVSIITTDCPVRFKLHDTIMGAYKHGERVDLPKYAAAYLLCKGFGKIPQ